MVHLNTKLLSCAGMHVELSNGERFDAETVVWTAGVKANPVLGHYGLPTDDRGRLRGTAFLNVDGADGAWSAGDCASIPDLTKGPGALCGPSAQHAVRQAKVLAHNIVRSIRGQDLKRYKHAYAGSVASLGLHKGVAEIYGVKLRGLPAWFMHRTYHVSRMPTFNRKVRVIADWTLALFFRREIVSFGSFADPMASFRAATSGSTEPGASQDVRAPVTTGTASEAQAHHQQP